MVPAMVLFVLFGLIGAAAVWIVQPWIEGLMAPSDAWYAQLGAGIASWIGAIAAGALGFVIALAITPPLSGPALEQIVGIQEQELCAPKREPSSFLQEMWCGVKAQVFAAIFVVPIVTVLWLVELFFPPAGVVTIPLKILVASFGLSWNLFDYPLTLRDVRMRDRFGFVMSHKRETLGFGLAFAALFWVPCFGVLMLPVGVAGATRLIWRILKADPAALPSLPRPEGSAQIDGNADLLAQAEVPVAAREQN